MLKRTGEIALTIIGGCFNILGLLLGVRLKTIDYAAFKSQLQAAGAEQNLSSKDINQIINYAQTAGSVITVFTIIILVLTGVGLFLLLRTKRAKTAGTLILIAGVLSLPELLVPGILLIIAGIMALVRKPKVEFTE